MFWDKQPEADHTCKFVFGEVQAASDCFYQVGTCGVCNKKTINTMTQLQPVNGKKTALESDPVKERNHHVPPSPPPAPKREFQLLKFDKNPKDE